MRRRKDRIIFALLAATMVVGCEGIPRGVEVGQVVPEYGALTLEGDSVHLAELRDEVVLLNVWATWCAPCREEIPALQTLHETHADRGLRIVGVSIDEAHDRQNVREFADGFGVTYTIWHDPSDLIRTRFVLTGVPTTLLIDREGKIVWRHLGPVTVDDPGLNAALEATLDAAEA